MEGRKLSQSGGWLHTDIVYPPADSHASRYWVGNYVGWTQCVNQ